MTVSLPSISSKQSVCNLSGSAYEILQSKIWREKFCKQTSQQHTTNTMINFSTLLNVLGYGFWVVKEHPWCVPFLSSVYLMIVIAPLWTNLGKHQVRKVSNR